MVEHQPRLLGSRVRFPAGAFAIFFRYLQGFGGSFRGGLAVGALAWTLSERERRRPSRIACEISFENDLTSSSSKSDSLVHVRDCTPSWVKELPWGRG